jgi:hypothetical protein
MDLPPIVTVWGVTVFASSTGALAVAASIFCIHLFGDLWSPKVVGYLSDRWGDLQRAVLWALPGALVVSAFFWCWLLATERRNQAAPD